MTRAPYGSWKSPITPDLIVSKSIGLGRIALDGDDIYWVESRPSEAGRVVLVRWTAASGITDVTPPPFNVRTTVHEYGGAAALVDDGTVYFSNFSDQRLYSQRPGEAPHALTPDSNSRLRYADAILDRKRRRLISVREDHSIAGHEALNAIVAVPIGGLGVGEALVEGSDFYSSPRLSPDGTRLAWLEWRHPNMPWDGTELWVGKLAADGRIVQKTLVAGSATESVFQPEWSPGGLLYFVSDRTGWWNLYRQARAGNIEPLCPMQAEFGQPQWVFGMSTYAFASEQTMVCSYEQLGVSHLAMLDSTTGRLDHLDLPYTEVAFLRSNGTRAVFRGASATEPDGIVSLDLATGRSEVLRSSCNITLDPGFVASPLQIEFASANGREAHALYYAPRNRDFEGPSGDHPPLIVISHGGPTAAATSGLSLEIQFWTSRGFAVADVNYGGSTGYGRAYRERLDGQWGVVDVDDCCHAARSLADSGEVDGNRLIIRGGSAGGYTTLSALTFRDVFKAGACYYGLSDLEASNETHKFESRYNWRLIGPWPQARDVYRARSPLFALDRLSCPIIFFQGGKDPVVLPNQSELMANAVRQKGLPVAYVLFEEESHGFRQARNIKRTFEAELYFYSQIFGFPLADAVEPVEISNLRKEPC